MPLRFTIRDLLWLIIAAAMLSASMNAIRSRDGYRLEYYIIFWLWFPVALFSVRRWMLPAQQSVPTQSSDHSSDGLE